jgi:hypothetical protein
MRVAIEKARKHAAIPATFGILCRRSMEFKKRQRQLLYPEKHAKAVDSKTTSVYATTKEGDDITNTFISQLLVYSLQSRISSS